MQTIGAVKRLVKDSGLVANLIASVIVATSGALLTLLPKWSTAFSYTLTLKLHAASLVGGIIVLGSAIYFITKFYTNPTRNFAATFGYYRKLAKMTYSPYVKKSDGFYTHHRVLMDFVILRDDITTLGPYTYYAHRPRSSRGREAVENVSATVFANGKPFEYHHEVTSVGTDGIRVRVRSNTPWKAGDKLTWQLDYDVLGMNALSREEIEKYISDPKLEDTVRHGFIREKRCELVCSSPAFASEYVVNVVFPERYPWRALDSVRDMATLTMSSRPVDPSYLRRRTNLHATQSSIEFSYRHRFPSGHWYYVFWNLPNTAELSDAGFL